MSSSIRIPVEIPIVDREGFGSAYANHRSIWEPEVGAARRRRKYRRTPRFFDLQFTLRQHEYYVFDNWYQFVIQSGAVPFDIQLLDDDESLMWYTVQGVAPYTYERNHNGEPIYLLRWRVRAMDEGFEVRLSGTDELGGAADVGVDNAYAAIEVAKALGGVANIDVTPTAQMALFPFNGVAEVGMYYLPRAQFAKPDYPQLSRHWLNLTLIRTIAAQDISSNADVVSRAWMEI